MTSRPIANTQRNTASTPVTELPTFKTFENGIVERCEVPPNVTRLAAQLVDCYGFGAVPVS